MIQYIVYQCSVCRKKTERQNNPRVININSCNLTDGCLGKLVRISSSNSALPKIITDYSSLDTNFSPNGIDTSSNPISDDYGTIYMAVKESSIPNNYPNISVSFSQLVNRPISYIKYTFNVSYAGLTILEGKDSNLKNLRFDSSAISEKRVIIKIDGIETDGELFSLTPNKVTFDNALSVGARVEIYIYSQSLVSTTDTVFSYTGVAGSTGAWSNIKHVKFLDSSQSKNRYIVYALRQPFSDIVKLRLDEIYIISGNQRENIPLTDCVFLLSNHPFSNYERVTSFVVFCEQLNQDYLISNLENTSSILSVSEDLIYEIFPPLEIENSSYINSNTDRTSTSAEFQLPSPKFILS